MDPWPDIHLVVPSSRTYLAMPLTSAQVKQHLGAIDRSVAQVVTQIDKVHGPHWEGRSELARNLVAIGVAVFAGTIALSERLLADLRPAQTWLILASWTLMLLSVSAGSIVLWHAANLRSFYPKYFNQRPALVKQIAALHAASPTLANDIAAILKITVDDALKPIGTADRAGHIAIRVCITLFFASLLCFLVFAVLRYAPSG